jgi:hypothetical protein
MLLQSMYNNRTAVLALCMWVGCAGEVAEDDIPESNESAQAAPPAQESASEQVSEGEDAELRRRRDAGTSTKPEAGVVPADAGVLPVDAGPAPADASVVRVDAGPPPADAGPAPVDAGLDASKPSVDAGAPAASDRFGVRMLYPTVTGGREWTLPDTAESASNEWNVETNPVTRVAAGVFHTLGNNGEVRLTVGSPSGRAWWRNVEMTAYFRYTAPHDSNDQLRHWEFVTRSERHARGTASASSINGGVSAPVGTATWPGYPFGGASVTANCLGSSYHGNFYPEGRGLFEKEITHTEGYASQRAASTVSGFANPQQRWFGLKYVIRNAGNDQRVHMELWLDANSGGDWQRLSQTDDSAGAWVKSASEIDGCTKPPFSYTLDQLITWAGPWVVFRSDSVEMDFRALSVREIAALP